VLARSGRAPRSPDRAQQRHQSAMGLRVATLRRVAQRGAGREGGAVRGARRCLARARPGRFASSLAGRGVELELGCVELERTERLRYCGRAPAARRALASWSAVLDPLEARIDAARWFLARDRAGVGVRRRGAQARSRRPRASVARGASRRARGRLRGGVERRGEGGVAAPPTLGGEPRSTRRALVAA
jgi:hypothetical protein